jgi:tetratricopeptide (TPR) repeat protein
MNLDPNAALQRAQMLQKAGDLAQAAAIYRQLAHTAPRNVQILSLLGAAEMQLGNVKEAAAAFRKSLQLAPKQPRTLCNLGVALHHLGRNEDALANLDRAIALMPNYTIALNNRGATLLILGRHAEALVSFERAIALEPGYAEAHNNRGNVLQMLERHEEALADFERAAALAPDYAAAHFNRGTALLTLCRWSEALAAYDRTLALEPDDAKAHCGRATALINLKRLDEATESNEHALALYPELAEAKWNKARLMLVSGDYAAGWDYYEARWQVPEFARDKRDLAEPLWDGEQPIAGKTLLVHAEQGYSDAIHCARYVPMAYALGAEVILEAHGRLLPLLATLKGGARLLAKGEPLPAFDLHCPVMSLPRAFKTTLATIPNEVPYLFSDPAKCEAVRARLGARNRPRIGLTWTGGVHRNFGKVRNIPLKTLAPVLRLPFEFHSLQKDNRTDDLTALAQFSHIARHENEQHDFSDAAALIDCMDLIITVDTAIAHLAGAMGKPVWILLHWMADWRWLLDRSDCPWYPTATLYRQNRRGDWTSVVDDIVQRLRTHEFPGKDG